MERRISALVAVMCWLVCGPMSLSHVYAQSPGADSVVAFTPGEAAGFGADSMPDVVLSVPHGAGDTEGSLDVLSLGVGGAITLYFKDDIIVDGPGPDFTVFENPFFIAGDSLDRYIEAAIVEVSRDGEEYYRFPFDFRPEAGPPGNPHRYVGLAGVEPVYSNDGYPDPTDPGVSGGDHFDLGQVGLPNASYIRIIDTGSNTRDEDGDLVTDNGLDLPPQAGFDLDAACRVNWTTRSNPFRVTSATALRSDRIVVDFSKVLSEGQEIPPEYFALDGNPLSDADSIRSIDSTTIAIHLSSPLPDGSPLPVLTVSQWIGSRSGENLIDDYGLPVEGVLGLGPPGEEVGEVRSAGVLPPYPNPFSGVTNILFDIPHEGDSRLEVYDLRGRRVRVLADRAFQAGRHNLQWAGDNQDRVSCPSGIYMIHFTFDGRSCLRKVVYVR